MLQAFINYNFSCTRFRARKTVLRARPCTWEIVHVKEQIYRLLIITWYRGKNWTQLILKPLAGNSLTASLFHSCVLLLPCRLYYFSLHDDYPPILQLAHYTICLHSSATTFDELKWEATMTMTMDHKLVIENSSSVAAEYLYLFKGHKVFEYQTVADLLNGPKGVRVRKIEEQILYYSCKDSGLLCWKLKTLW